MHVCNINENFQFINNKSILKKISANGLFDCKLHIPTLGELKKIECKNNTDETNFCLKEDVTVDSKSRTNDTKLCQEISECFTLTLQQIGSLTYIMVCILTKADTCF